jgi:hypothetical protein
MAHLSKVRRKKDFRTRNLNHDCNFHGRLILRAHRQDRTNGGHNLDKRGNELAFINTLPTTYAVA